MVVTLRTSFNATMYTIVAAPVKHTLLHGPHILWCWRGMKHEDVCRDLTGVEAKFWESNPEQCEDVIDRHAWSFAVVLYMGLYFVTLLRLLFFLPSVTSWFWRTWQVVKQHRQAVEQVEKVEKVKREK